MRHALVGLALVLLTACTADETTPWNTPSASSESATAPADSRRLEATNAFAKQRNAALRKLADAALKDALALVSGQIAVSPAAARPGEVVALFSPSEQLRGMTFTLDSRRGDSLFLLTASQSAQGGTWSYPNGSHVVPDIGVGGPGPDYLKIPEVARPGQYRLCTANARKEACADLTVQ